MQGKHRCIICGSPVEEGGGFLGTIRGISVVFCKEHAEECEEKCETCAHSDKCPVCGKFSAAVGT